MSNIETYIANGILILLAFAVGFLIGRLWEIVLGSVGMTLDEAIQAEREIRRYL